MHSKQVKAREWAVCSNELVPGAKVGPRNKGRFHRGGKTEKAISGFWFLFISRRDLDGGQQAFPVKHQTASISDSVGLVVCIAATQLLRCCSSKAALDNG